MTNKQTLLKAMQQRWPDALSFPPQAISALADQMEDALAAQSRSSVLHLRDDLLELQSDMVRIAPKETMDALLQDEDEVNPITAAYKLGQINFAQVLAAQVAERRVCDEFISALQASGNRAYLNAMMRAEYSNNELASLAGEVIETVSRKLKLLRSLGICDFRRDGKHTINFLTPAARELMASFAANKVGTATMEPVRANAIERLRASTPETFRKQPQFGKLAA